MSQVYSIRMYEMHNLSGAGLDVGPGPGFLWVVRGIDVVNGEALNEVQAVGPSGQVFWANGFVTSIGFDYASYRGRFVVNELETIRLQTTKSMDVSMWGYQLTLP